MLLIVRIKTVECIDSFEKPEWGGKKSLTFRFEVYDEKGTLTKEIIDEVWAHAVEKRSRYRRGGTMSSALLTRYIISMGLFIVLDRLTKWFALTLLSSNLHT